MVNGSRGGRVVMALVLVAACGGTRAPGGPTATGDPVDNIGVAATAAARARDVDWGNRAYDLSAMGLGGPFQLVDGAVAVRSAPDGSGYVAGEGTDEDHGSVFAAAAVFGDLTGDGADEAVVQVFLNPGTTGGFSSVFVYTMQGDQPVELGIVPGGESRADGVEALWIEDGALWLERDVQLDDPPAPAGAELRVERWTWTGAALALDPAPPRYLTWAESRAGRP